MSNFPKVNHAAGPIKFGLKDIFDSEVFITITIVLFLWEFHYSVSGYLAGNWRNITFSLEFCYGMYNQCESFICLDLIVKNREVPIERYFKW
jgi:hypothetical protein